MIHLKQRVNKVESFDEAMVSHIVQIVIQFLLSFLCLFDFLPVMPLEELFSLVLYIDQVSLGFQYDLPLFQTRSIRRIA